MKLRYKPIKWADMPMSARKAWRRYTQAIPAYDLSLTKGWEWFQAIPCKQYVFAVNRSGDWYVAEAAT